MQAMTTPDLLHAVRVHVQGCCDCESDDAGDADAKCAVAIRGLVCGDELARLRSVLAQVAGQLEHLHDFSGCEDDACEARKALSAARSATTEET